MSNAVSVRVVERKLIVAFNRPEIRNPLSRDVLDQLLRIVSGITDETERLIFTGTDDVFASGADLKEIAIVPASRAADFATAGQELMSRIASLKVITVAAINGLCFGGALDLALSCDRRIASPRAIFSHPGANLGIMTGWGGTQRLPRIVGQGLALEMFFTARRVTADEALRIGLVDEVVTDPLRAALHSDLLIL